MLRKVNRVGTGTLTISLPSKWVKENDIKQGDELEVVQEGRNLTFVLEEVKPGHDVEFDLPHSLPFMTRLVCGPYLKGCRSITFRYADPLMYSQILGSLKHTIGFEVVEQRDGFCKLAEISKGAEENFEAIVVRLLHLLLSFADDVHLALREDVSRLNALLEMEYACDRLSLYCRRIINLGVVGGVLRKNTGVYHLVCLAEQAGDELKKIIESFPQSEKFSFDSRLSDVFSALRDSIQLTTKKLANYLGAMDYAKQIGFAVEQRVCRKKADVLNRQAYTFDGFNIVILHHVVTAVELVQHMSEELL